MKNKWKKIISLTSAISATLGFSIIVASCAQKTEPSQQNQQSIEQNNLVETTQSNNGNENLVNHYFPNPIFLNKIKPENKEELNIEFKVSQEDDSAYKYPISLVYKVLRGEEFNADSLPKDIEVLDNNNNSKWFNVNWNVNENIKITRDIVIKGTANNGTMDLEVKAYIFVQTKRFNLVSDYRRRDTGLSIDVEKSTRDGGGADSLAKIINRDGDYAHNGSRWDNWGAYNREQNTNIVFHWNQLTEISRVNINFWAAASNGNSNGIMPKRIIIQHSTDGINWVDVNNQDKINSADFGPMRSFNGNSLVSETKQINFQPINTQWIRFHWEPATDAQNRNLIIGITNMEFLSKDKFNDEIISNISDGIIGVNYNSNRFEFNQNDTNYVFEVENFDDDFKILSHATVVDKYLVQKNENQEIYKLVAYNDKNQRKVYQITFNKKVEVSNEN